MAIGHKRALVLIAVVFALLAIPCVKAQQPPAPQKVVHLMGLSGAKDNVKGTLSAENECGCLQFVRGKASTDIGATSIQGSVAESTMQQRDAVLETVAVVQRAHNMTSEVADSVYCRHEGKSRLANRFHCSPLLARGTLCGGVSYASRFSFPKKEPL